ncbi:hypothetical protein NDA16_000767 [Ustilago loliicola]|nr:hypothetical protein NDA16_000767 [Ustilago loliicola]
MAKTKTPIMDLETDEDGWIGGGASQSIYAPKSNANPASYTSPPPAPKAANRSSPKTPGREKSQSGDVKSRSLLERMEMAQNLQTPPSKSRNAQSDSNQSAQASSSTTPSPSNQQATSPFRTTPSQGIRRPGAKIPSPLPLTSPARNNGPVSPLNTRTPLSASHPIPETPLKLSQPGDNVRSPLNDALHLRGRAASSASIGSPLKSGRSDLQAEPLALGSSSSSANQGGNGQIDAMLDRLRNTRSGLGTSASMWAPEPATNDSNASSSLSTSTTSHTIGSGFSSSNLLGVQIGLDRKRPSHRPNGLQLSLGQEISVMQQLAEGAEEDYPASNVSSATAGETFRIDSPANDAANGDQDGWQGTVVPPTPSLGCDSPSDDDAGAAKAPSRSLDAFGWGSHGSTEPRKSSLFSKLPSSSKLEANWSGDDDDDRKDDVKVFEDMQRAAKASNKEKRNSSYAPLPPPSLNYAKSRTPSPTHHGFLVKSPQLDGPADNNSNRGATSPSLNAPKLGALPAADASATKPSNQRLSPGSTRSQLPSEDSDGDADVETEKPNGGRERKASKKHEVKGAETGCKDADDAKADDLQVNVGGLEKKRSLKRDKSERIRGRRASQSKEKDVDKVKMIAPAVSLPTANFTKHEDEELAQSIQNVSLKQETAPAIASRSETQQQTPVAQRVQSIPTVKDDLFSSPAEPKVELPGSTADRETAEAGLSEPAAEAAAATPVPAPAPALAEEAEVEKKQEESAPEKTPEPMHAKTMSFDWAADDDELDDQLPDLDDWGVTLTPAKPTTVVRWEFG